MNYAMPTATADQSSIEEMIEAFKAHSRMPYMEIFRETWQELPKLLEKNGFVCQAELPMLVCGRTDFIPFCADTITSRMLTPEDDFTEYFAIGAEAFVGPAGPSDSQVARTKSQVRDGLLNCAVAFVDGNAAASACTTPFQGICELAGVATRPSLRRRGAARAVSSFLLEHHFKEGELAWLSTAHDESRTLYEKLGFRLIGTQLNYALK